MYDSLAEQASESDWSEEEKRQWYRERAAGKEYYVPRPATTPEGRTLTRKVWLTQLPPHREGEPALQGHRH